jgi:hypothetical protein
MQSHGTGMFSGLQDLLICLRLRPLSLGIAQEQGVSSRPRTIAELKQNIREDFAATLVDTTQRMMGNLVFQSTTLHTKGQK